MYRVFLIIAVKKEKNRKLWLRAGNDVGLLADVMIYEQ